MFPDILPISPLDRAVPPSKHVGGHADEVTAISGQDEELVRQRNQKFDDTANWLSDRGGGKNKLYHDFKKLIF